MLAVAALGCSTVHPRDDVWARDLNAHGAAYPAKLVYVDGIDQEDQGTEVVVDGKETRWKESAFGNARAIPNDRMRHVSFVTGRGHARGALEGAVIGAVVGALVVTLAVAAISDPAHGGDRPTDGPWERGLGYGLYAAPFGALAGAAVGAMGGHRTVFDYRDPR